MAEEQIAQATLTFQGVRRVASFYGSLLASLTEPQIQTHNGCAASMASAFIPVVIPIHSLSLYTEHCIYISLSHFHLLPY